MRDWPRRAARNAALVGVLLFATVLLASCDVPDFGRVDGEAVEAATILTEHTDSGTATLKDGEFRAPGSPSELVIYLGEWTLGDLDGDGITDVAAITIENPGGSGNLRFLHALLSEEGELRDGEAFFLGDRIRVGGLSIHEGIITAAILVRPPDAPDSERPSIFVIRRFRLAGDSLQEISGYKGADAFVCDQSLPDASLVIVTSPASGEEVANGFTVRGCSRTFESNVQWRLLDRTGEELANGFTMGGGIDGPAPFEFTIEYATTNRQIAYLEVYEEAMSEAEDLLSPHAVVPLVIAATE